MHFRAPKGTTSIFTDDSNLPRNISAREGQGHGHGVLQVGHDHGGDGEHEAAHDLLRVVVVLRVGKADAGTVDCHPPTPGQE